MASNVTAHFEFGGRFWTVIALLVVGGLALMWRDEIKLVFQRMRDSADANRKTS